MLNLLAVFTEFETELCRERQMAGIEAAKEKGGYKGRRKSVDDAKIIALRCVALRCVALRCVALRAEGHGPAKIAKWLKINRASVYRALKSD